VLLADAFPGDLAPAMTVLLLPSNANEAICEPPLANGNWPPRCVTAVRLFVRYPARPAVAAA
jgi:hypothetical protein